MKSSSRLPSCALKEGYRKDVPEESNFMPLLMRVASSCREAGWIGGGAWAGVAV